MAKFDVYLFGTTYLNDKPQSVPKNPMYGGDIPDYDWSNSSRKDYYLDSPPWLKPFCRRPDPFGAHKLGGFRQE